MAIHLPSDVIVHVLIPLIVTGEFPVNQSSIKMLTKLVEHHGPGSIEPRLSDLMPGIMKVCKISPPSIQTIEWGNYLCDACRMLLSKEV